MDIHIKILETIAYITQIQFIGPIIIGLSLLSIIKIFRFLSVYLLSVYLLFVALFFTFNDFGIDSIKVYKIKRTLIPEAYTSYKQDLKLMKTFMLKRGFSYYIYQNMDNLNEEFKYILDFLEKEKNNTPKIIKENKEILNNYTYIIQ